MNRLYAKLIKATTRTTSGNYVTALDGLRFIAIVPVVIHHFSERIYRKLIVDDDLNHMDYLLIDLLPSGRIGVQIFFAISGYVIASQLLKYFKDNEANKFSYLQYLKRRLTRLEPPYLICMGLIFLALIAMSHFSADSFLLKGTNNSKNADVSIYESAVASAFYAHGLWWNSLPALNPPAWSLELEFQFYIIAPILVFLILQIKNHCHVLVFGFSSVIILLAYEIAINYLPFSTARFYVFYWLDFFLVGVLLSFFDIRKIIRTEQTASTIFLVSLCVLFLADYYQFTSDEVQKTISRILILAGTSGLFISGLSGRGVGHKFLSLSWVSRLGGMCYTIYLFHLLAFQVMVALAFKIFPVSNFMVGMMLYGAIIIPVTLIGCTVFFILVEKPCMNPEWVRKLSVRLRLTRAS